MTFLGILSLLQISFLPGFIFARIFLEGKSITKLILSFGLSLIVNFQLVFLLTVIGLYTKTSVLVIFVFEILLLIFIYARKIRYTATSIDFTVHKPDSENGLLTLPDSYSRILKYLFIASAIFVFMGYFSKILAENPGIFDSWDDVFSWNRWASEWYSGQLPRKTYHYPQLLPANWSMTYKFIGTDGVQFFAKSIMGLFGLGILFIFWDLYRKSKSIYFLLALTIAGYIIQKVVGPYLGKGYADIPVAFFGLCIFYIFYLGINGYLPITISMMISAIMLSGAALTKQPGFFMILMFVVMSFYLLKGSNHSFRRNAMIFGLSIIIYCISTGPWYTYKQTQIKKGIENSEVGWVTKGIYAGKNMSQRFIDATTNFSNKMLDFDFLKSMPDHRKNVLTGFLAIFFLALALLSLLSLYGRISLIFVVIPYYFIWAYFFSYDLRNISILLPFLGLSLAIGSIILLKYLSRLIAAINRKKLNWQVVILSVIILFIAGVSFKYNDSYLLYKEREKARMLVGDTTLNSKLYELYDSNRLSGNILSGYEFLKYLPDIKRYYYGFKYDKENLDSLKVVYLQNKKDHKIEYFIYPEYAPPEVRDFFNQKEKEGGLKTYFRSDAGWLIEETLER